MNEEIHVYHSNNLCRIWTALREVHTNMIRKEAIAKEERLHASLPLLYELKRRYDADSRRAHFLKEVIDSLRLRLYELTAKATEPADTAESVRLQGALRRRCVEYDRLMKKMAEELEIRV